MLSDLLGGKEKVVEFEGRTTGDLIRHLLDRYGAKARKALYDQEGQLDLTIQILRNEKEWISHEELDRPLADGDTLIFMLLAAGG
jgi:molybdopterin converting factor small subunit